MRLEKAGAVFLMAIVALWTAMPAFACIQKAPVHRACCGLMRDCHSSTAMNGKKCCINRPQAELAQPATPGSDEGGYALTAIAVAPGPTTALILRASAVIASENSPPGQSPGAPFNLRI